VSNLNILRKFVILTAFKMYFKNLDERDWHHTNASRWNCYDFRQVFFPSIHYIIKIIKKLLILSKISKYYGFEKKGQHFMNLAHSGEYNL
jgi:hypothetical protein